MRYAGRVIDLQSQLGFDTPTTKFLDLMSAARSNDPTKGNGAEIFWRFATSGGSNSMLAPSIAGSMVPQPKNRKSPKAELITQLDADLNRFLSFTYRSTSVAGVHH